MPETVRTYLLSNPYSVQEMDRDEFYDEQILVWKKDEKPTRAVETVAIFLFNEEGKLLIQKRSRSKRHNPKAFDKSVGGHMVSGNSLIESAFFELIQEMHVPSTVHVEERAFKKYLKELTGIDGALKHVAVVKFIDTGLHLLGRVIDGERYVIANKVNLFFGFYDGGVYPSDKESTGYAWTTLAELADDMSESSGFTEDLAYFIKTYEKQIQEFLALRG